MPKNRKNVQPKAHRDSNPPAARRKKPIPFWMVMAGLLVVAGGAYYYFTSQSDDFAPLEYAEEQVVRDRPIRAIHEMGDGPPIRFLPEGQPQPKIVVPEGTYNFGNIGATAVVKYRFAVYNTGDGPLTISRAYTTCGCTTADITARVIPPGKVALVTIIFDAGFHDTRGQQVRRGLIIENNDRSRSKAEIWTRASVGN